MQMNDMVGQVVRIIRGRADDSRLKLIYPTTDVPEIEADPRAVKQILLNLATNAIKFTPEGGTVRITIVPNSAGLIITVKDSGIGISAEDIERLAEPFIQIDSQHSRQHEGTGLGLALTKSLVELHGGNFKIESTVGQGTSVTFTLPNSPLVKKKETPSTEVGNEITRLAADIANVLTDDNVDKVATQTARQVQAPPALSSANPQNVTAPGAPPPLPAQTIPQGQAKRQSPDQTQAQTQTQTQAPPPPPADSSHYPIEYKPGNAA